MDPAGFDALVRAASRSGSRRGLLGGLAALALSPLAVQAKPEPGGQSACKAPGQSCRKRANCCATPCRKKRGKPAGRCAACPGGASFCGTVCCQPGEDCVGGACTCRANGAACGQNDACCSGNCTNGFCCAAGRVGLVNGSCALPCDTNVPGSCSGGCGNLANPQCAIDATLNQGVCRYGNYGPLACIINNASNTLACPVGQTCDSSGAICSTLC